MSSTPRQLSINLFVSLFISSSINRSKPVFSPLSNNITDNESRTKIQIQISAAPWLLNAVSRLLENQGSRL